MIITKRNRLAFLIFSFFLMSLSNCATKPATGLPPDILGISVGMNKEDAQRRLEEIGSLETKGRKVGQLWKLKNKAHFDSLGVEFDKENRVRFVTAFVEKTTAKEKYKFTDIGDISTARAEIVEPHYRYIWEVPADGERVAYTVNVYGDNPEFITVYSLAKKN